VSLSGAMPGVNCPVCSALCSEPPLYRYSTAEAAAHFCPVTRSEERYRRLEACIRKLWQSEECVILRCAKCGFAFGHPFVSGDEVFYNILHEQKGYPAWRWDYQVAVDEALSKVHSGRILDIGAGEGKFLRRLGPNWLCYAVEASETNRKYLEGAGITVFRDLNAAAQVEVGTFHVVTLFQVLEHIAGFRLLLSQCRQLLCPGGLLVVTVPDCDAMIRQERMTGCPDMPPNHINKWTPASLALALRETGFEPGQAISEPPSWRKIGGNLYLRVSTDAKNPRSLAARIYRVRNKRLRAPLLMSLGVPMLLKMLPHFRQLRRGGAFGMVATAR
jgi:SAM-dependent methyltransferase